MERFDWTYQPWGKRSRSAGRQVGQKVPSSPPRGGEDDKLYPCRVENVSSKPWSLTDRNIIYSMSCSIPLFIKPSGSHISRHHNIETKNQVGQCNTREHDFGTWKVYCVSNVTLYAEFKYATKIFPSPTVLLQWLFLLIFRNIRYFFNNIIISEPIF